MKLKDDVSYSMLSESLLNQIENLYQNCNKNDIADHIFNLLYDSNEVSFNDIYRLAFKILNDFQKNRN